MFSYTLQKQVDTLDYKISQCEDYGLNVSWLKKEYHRKLRWLKIVRFFGL